VLICDIYIRNYLNSTGREPWERSLHYNGTIENVQKACIADVQREDWPHVSLFKTFDLTALSPTDHSLIMNIQTESFRPSQINFRNIEFKVSVLLDVTVCLYNFQVAAGSLEVLFVEDQVNSENITTMADIQANFHTNLEDELAKLAEIMDLSRAEVEDLLSKLTTTVTTTVTPSTTFATTTTVSTTMVPTTMTTTATTITEVSCVHFSIVDP